ncbi:unnamed protein product [Diatraea saccharalis]|uniref:FP protein C-terminal domain-containing protein n=1 Tax=Diatraea saccharalis TaxID=40085 RepID=A0A9N9WB14_9NEOP|nr:unnamed protein product [Diatraea saccharalis]
MHLKDNIKDQGFRLGQVKQQSRQSNIELQCVTEYKSENLLQIIAALGKTVGCVLDNGMILNYTRTAKVNRSSTRRRSIIVQLALVRLRDQLLASTISYNKANPKNKLNSSHLGLNGKPSPVFIAEHLSPTNKALHAAARLTAKEKEYKFVWVRNGKVFLRKN